MASNFLNSIANVGTKAGKKALDSALDPVKNAKKNDKSSSGSMYISGKPVDMGPGIRAGNSALITQNLVKGIGKTITGYFGGGGGDDDGSDNNNNSGPGSWGYGGGGYGGGGGSGTDPNDIITNVLTPVTAAGISAGKDKMDQLANNFRLADKANQANLRSALVANNVQNDNEWWRSVYNPIIQTAISIGSRMGNGWYSSTADEYLDKLKWQEEIGSSQIIDDWKQGQYDAQREYVEAWNKSVADFLAKLTDTESANKQVYFDYLTQVANLDADTAKKMIKQGVFSDEGKSVDENLKKMRGVSNAKATKAVYDKAPKWAMLNIYDQMKNNFKFKTADFPDYIRPSNATNKAVGKQTDKTKPRYSSSTDTSANQEYWNERYTQTYRNR